MNSTKKKVNVYNDDGVSSDGISVVMMMMLVLAQQTEWTIMIRPGLYWLLYIMGPLLSFKEALIRMLLSKWCGIFMTSFVWTCVCVCAVNFVQTKKTIWTNLKMKLSYPFNPFSYWHPEQTLRHYQSSTNRKLSAFFFIQTKISIEKISSQ